MNLVPIHTPLGPSKYSGGLAIALLAPIPTYMIFYVVQPLPGDMVIKQIIGDGLLVVALGVLTAFLNKPKDSTAN